MSENIQNTIRSLADELKQFNRNDVLVNFPDKESISLEKDLTSIDLPNAGELRQTIKKARNVFRESGTSIFCLSKGILHWEWNGAECQTPILLQPSDFKENKIKKEFHLSWKTEEAFLNPFLNHFFKKKYDFDWPIIDSETPDWSKIQAFLIEKGFEISVAEAIHFGNFHHHRFSILRELESLADTEKYNRVLEGLFHENKSAKPPVFSLSSQNLFPADKDQLSVLNSVAHQDLVVQGPPGTGKSQVLSNLLGKNLDGNLRTLVVSEKRVALKVIQQKMESIGLQHFLFLQGENSSAQHLLDQLKSSWRILEEDPEKEQEALPLAKFKLDRLQMKLDILSDSDRIGGVSYMTFQSLVRGMNLSNIKYASNAPTLSEFLDQKRLLESLFEKELNKIAAVLPKAILNSDSIFQLDKKIQNLKSDWIELQKVVPFSNMLELKDTLTDAIFAHIMQNEVHKDYFGILRPNSSEQKKFKRLSKKYFILKKDVSNRLEKQTEWKNPPSILETEQLIKESKLSGFFEKRKFKKRMKMLLKNHLAPFDDLLQVNLEIQQKQSDFREIEKKLTEIGIQTETEVHWVKGLLEKTNEQKWQKWQSREAALNEKIADSNGLLNKFHQNVRTYFALSDESSFEKAFTVFQTHFASFLEQRKTLSTFSKGLYDSFGESINLLEFEKVVLKSNWIRFVEQFPSFSDFELPQIATDLEEILQQEIFDSQQFAKQIQRQQKAKFDALNSFLQIPARKLNEEEKARKVRLRRGRSLLIKEFGKSRSHPTIRELLESDAAEWIYSLLPIWMVNSSQVGDFFPLEKDLFDMVLFDEATQIPLRNSLGSMFRGKRAVVLGDEHQMSPTSYFKAGDSEPIDLLHQAVFNWPKVMLKHHYRSQDPALISFSNRFFYKNELIAYPKAARPTNPVEVQFIENGIYQEQENENEAKALAQKLVSILSDTSKSVGIVAFSEKQLKCIFRQLNTADQLKLEERIENNTAFFRALENVQGDECDCLLISLGYGPNPEAKLNLNFGPLNRKSGPRRLNVLFSRAKQKIHFFTSIKSSDLSISDNDALNLLRQFLQSNEEGKEIKNENFPHNLEIKTIHRLEKKSKISFTNLFETITDAQELLTLYSVLTARGWEIEF